MNKIKRIVEGANKNARNPENDALGAHNNWVVIMNDKDFVNILVFLKFVIVEKIKPYKADPNNTPK